MGKKPLPLQLGPEQVRDLGRRRDTRLNDLIRTLRAQEVPTSGALEFAEAASDLVDEIVGALRDAAQQVLERERGREAADSVSRIALVALGGFGRRELCPYSDVDLLFLLPGSDEEEPVDEETVSSLVDMVLYGLWDLGYEVGHAAKTIDQCVEVAEADAREKTSLIEARPIGSQRSRLVEKLTKVVETRMLTRSAADLLIRQKLEEAERLRVRYGDSIYRLEPEVKHGMGGLRELHSALWIGRARWRTRTIEDLLKLGILSPREAHNWSRTYNFLLRVRTELHLESKRRRDGLSFESQEAIARSLGYVSGEGDQLKRVGTERFMRAYYYHAFRNRRIARLVIERATSHPKQRPSERGAPGGFKTFGGMLTVSERDQLSRDPSALMRIFRVAQEESLEIYSYTKDLIIESLTLLDRRLRRHPEVILEFLIFLEDPGSDGDTSHLELMHELGVLRRFIPELRRISARWQHSLYHVYTVDIHSLFVVKELKRLRAGRYASSHPMLTRLMADLSRTPVLYLAGLLHDVGKGWNRKDHSAQGAKVATTVGKRLEEGELPSWSGEETTDLVWLVQEHLAMSHISQRRDLSDEELIEAFARGCRTRERLHMLYLLTFADMKATSPKVWSDWKASLLSELFLKANDLLSGEAPRPRSVELRRERAARELTSRGEGTVDEGLARAFVSSLPERYLFAVSGAQLMPHFRSWLEVSERPDRISISMKHLGEGATELTVACPDRPGLLAMLAGTFAANRFEILAQIYSIDLNRREGEEVRRAALDILTVRDVDGGPEAGLERWSQLRSDLRAVVLEKENADELLDRRALGSNLGNRQKPRVETKVEIITNASTTDTVIDVFCQDHLGALAAIAKAITNQGLTIRLAKISTQGDRVADGFYVTDAITGQRVEDERLPEIVRAVSEAIEKDLVRS